MHHVGVRTMWQELWYMWQLTKKVLWYPNSVLQIPSNFFSQVYYNGYSHYVVLRVVRTINEPYITMELTTNYKKHTSANPVQRFLLSRFNRRLVESVRLCDPQTILDAGCGEGFTMSLLLSSGLRATMKGIDFSDEAIAIAKKTAPELAISKASIYELPFKKSSFDLVICSEVLEHLEDPDRAIAEISRVSKKYVLVSVPNEPYFQIANFLRGKYPRTFGNHPEHINHWSSDAIVSRLKYAGLSIVRVHRPFAWTLVLASK